MIDHEYFNGVFIVAAYSMSQSKNDSFLRSCDAEEEKNTDWAKNPPEYFSAVLSFESEDCF